MIIDITGGRVLIDDEDLDLICQYKWHVNDSGYAVWRGVEDGVKKTVRMHRLVTSCPVDKIIDHKNHNKLDNRKVNLHIGTHSDNMRNLTNQGKGYWFQKKNNNWVVEINGLHRGTFATEEEASQFAKDVRAGLVDKKPKIIRTTCKYGHSLVDAYQYAGYGKLCRVCQSERSKAYFKRAYVPKPRKEVIFCPRGHDKRLTKTSNGDCRMCATIRAKEQRSRNANARRDN